MNDVSIDPAARLDEVAKIFAGGILRYRHRQLLKPIPAPGTPENRLELCASTSAHGRRNGEPTP